MAQHAKLSVTTLLAVELKDCYKVQLMYINKGFTLIELLIVVAIISMTMAIGLPSFQSIIASTRLTSAANAMVSALQLAKMEAIKQHKTVVVIKKTTWEKGWDVFVDTNSNGLQDSTEPTFATFDALSSTITVPVGTGKTTSSYSTGVKYKSTGRFGSANGHFLFCSVAAKDFRVVGTELSGRIHVETASNSTTTYATSGC